MMAPSRFASIAAWPARFILALLFVAVLASAALAPTPEKTVTEAAARRGVGRADVILYDRIVADLRSGQAYYPAAARELRAGDYPLRPFVTFRLPTLAWIEAAISPLAMTLLLWSVVLLTLGVWGAWLWRSFGRAPPVAMGIALLAAGLGLAVQRELIVFHDIWAGLLIALALGLRGAGRWRAAIGVALAAMLIRELALLFVAVMAAIAWAEGERREAGWWTAAIALFALALGLHAMAVAHVTIPADPASPGWSGEGGWRFFVTAARLTSPLRILPAILGAALVPLALFGWVAWPSRIALRGFAALAAYALLLSLFGRPDNYYWSMCFAPILPVGLLFVLAGLRDLARAALSRQRPHIAA